jgi:hypothetical protein
MFKFVTLENGLWIGAGLVIAYALGFAMGVIWPYSLGVLVGLIIAGIDSK